MNYYHPATLEHICNPLPAVAGWATATELAVPDYDPKTQQCKFVDGNWVAETPVPDTSARAAEIKVQIMELESKCDRDLRDVVLGKGDIKGKSGKTPKEYLIEYDAQIVSLRVELAGL